ncbi:MAG: UvrD-helicase domain-containing protein [Candidatus Cloacimonetes bacterium]|nr:UvrD-helicase domain-containing protein [Candidatus Cloacimonadota bacterium]
MNKIIVSCAGSGKTTYLVNKAMRLSVKNKVLITTFTDNNTEEIVKKFYELFGFKPANVDVLPWFTFQLKHLIRPYQLPFIEKRINNIIMVQGKSTTYKGNNDKENYVMDDQIFSDKIALLAFKTLTETKHTLSRLQRIYSYIFIDEFQDMEGYDLEIIKLLSKNNIKMDIVCDPRQHTFSTHYDAKNHKYTCTPLKYIEEQCSDYFEIDETTLNGSYRCPKNTILYASTIFPDLPQSDSLKEHKEGDGIHFIKKSLIDDFLENNCDVLQLRSSISTKVNDSYNVTTFGKSKGLTRENVLIYPTKPMLKAILLNNFLNYKSKCDLYVALTRAQHKTGIIVPDEDYAKFVVIEDYINSFLKSDTQQ